MNDTPAEMTVTKPKPLTVNESLKKMMPQFAMVLPKHITPERLCRIALNACHSTPKLLECEPRSLYAAIMRSAQLGLEPDGVLGQAYLIPFKRNFKDANGQWQSIMEVQFIAGYKGLIDLARRSGDVSNIIAKEVYSGDEFTIDWSQEIPFIHKPKMEGERGIVTHFWAMARFKDGGFHWDYLTVAEVNAIRDKGNGSKNAVWSEYYIEMGKKTAIRRIAKYLPMSVQKATASEDLAEAGKSFSVSDYGDIILENEEIKQDEADDRKGNDAVKEKLKKKAAKEAGADAETGEIKASKVKTESFGQSIPSVNQEPEKTPPAVFGQAFNKLVANIPGKNITDLALIRYNNADFIKEILAVNPDKYNELAHFYNQHIEGAGGKDTAFMPIA